MVINSLEVELLPFSFELDRPICQVHKPKSNKKCADILGTIEMVMVPKDEIDALRCTQLFKRLEKLYGVCVMDNKIPCQDNRIWRKRIHLKRDPFPPSIWDPPACMEVRQKDDPQLRRRIRTQFFTVPLYL